MPMRLQAQHVLLLLHLHWCCWELSAVSRSVVWVCFFPSESSITWISRNLPIWLLFWSQNQGVCWVLASSHLKNRLLLLTIGLERESFVMGAAFTGHPYSETFWIKSQCPEHICQDQKWPERKHHPSTQCSMSRPCQQFVPCAPAIWTFNFSISLGIYCKQLCKPDLMCWATLLQIVSARNEAGEESYSSSPPCLGLQQMSSLSLRNLQVCLSWNWPLVHIITTVFRVCESSLNSESSLLPFIAVFVESTDAFWARTVRRDAHVGSSNLTLLGSIFQHPVQGFRHPL